MPLPPNVLAFRSELASYTQLVELMQAGMFSTREKHGGADWVDTTAQNRTPRTAWISELKGTLALHSAGTENKSRVPSF